jgi:hypothetical protein
MAGGDWTVKIDEARCDDDDLRDIPEPVEVAYAARS